MILASMTSQQRFDEVADVNQKLRSVCASGRIAGGYPRDAWIGVDASDIDFWIPIRFYRSPDRRRALVESLGRALDQYGLERTSSDGYGNNQSATLVNETWGPGASFFNRGSHNPLNVIFVEHSEAGIVHEFFDVGLCQYWVSPGGGIGFTQRAYRDHVDNNLSLIRSNFDNTPVETIVAYTRKLKRKFPNFAVRLDPLTEGLYQQLFDVGVLDAPRQMVQAQTEGTTRDEVRLNDGASSVRITATPRGIGRAADFITIDEIQRWEDQAARVRAEEVRLEQLFSQRAQELQQSVRNNTFAQVAAEAQRNRVRSTQEISTGLRANTQSTWTAWAGTVPPGRG